jgi:rare lipoprotein A
MRKWLKSNKSLTALLRGAVSRWQLLALCAALIAVAALSITTYQRHAARVAAEQAEDEEEERWSAGPSEADRGPDALSPAQPKRPPRKPREVYATWYDVPDESLAKRRAGPHEFTAAHNRLPLGTLVRVTHLKNGKTVDVRITDRGIHDRKVKLDVCKEAAEQLGIVRKGVARVRMEVIAEEHSASSSDAHTAAPHP